MLIDDIIQIKSSIGGCDLISARKFLLKGDFVETCAEFVEEESFTETMQQMSRLPFGSEVHVFELQKPSYAVTSESDVVTFVCKEVLIDGESHIQLFYLVGKHLFPYIILFCPQQIERHPTGEISVPFRVIRPSGEPVKAGSLEHNAEQRILAGTITLSSILAVLNSPKIIETLDVNHDEWNVKRQKHKQKILHNHTVVSIKREIREAVQKQNEGLPEEVDSKGKRIHWRRGHFKHRATGTFWWSATLVGSGTGLVEKRYDVNA